VDGLTKREATKMKTARHTAVVVAANPGQQLKALVQVATTAQADEVQAALQRAQREAPIAVPVEAVRVPVGAAEKMINAARRTLVARIWSLKSIDATAFIYPLRLAYPAGSAG
jgi:hypothetical protein